MSLAYSCLADLFFASGDFDFLSLTLLLSSSYHHLTMSVAIIGAGVAGLSCARTLKKVGVDAVIYEARDRVGGRVRFKAVLFSAGRELILGPVILRSAREWWQS